MSKHEVIQELQDPAILAKCHFMGLNHWCTNSESIGRVLKCTNMYVLEFYQIPFLIFRILLVENIV